MSLKEIFKRRGSDKWEHGYHQFYETLPPPARMLEVGVFKGASLRAWKRWWLDARVIGLDDFARGPQPDPNELNTIRADSRTWEAPPQWMGTFQLLIDDGSHHPRDQAATFRNLWPLVAPGGVYCIEDVLIVEEGKELPKWFAERAEHFNLAAWRELCDTISNPSYFGKADPPVIHDFRDYSGKPDSVLISVRKATNQKLTSERSE